VGGSFAAGTFDFNVDVKRIEGMIHGVADVGELDVLGLTQGVGHAPAPEVVGADVQSSEVEGEAIH
jgi:hypothetical protein